MSDIKIGKITLGMYQTNCYLVYDADTKSAIVIDPADSGDYIYEKLTQNGLNVKAILLTHGHFDHIFGVKALKAKTKAKVYAGIDEEELLKDVRMNCSASVGRAEMIVPDIFLRDKEECNIDGISFKVLHTPGHTAGSVCFYFEDAKILVAGDTLFAESIGRTDLPTGSGRKIIESITDVLMSLPDDVKVYSGHGPSTTIGYERENNPFIN